MEWGGINIGDEREVRRGNRRYSPSTALRLFHQKILTKERLFFS